MIVYRKEPGLRIRRTATPQAPFWCATSVAPYSNRRGQPVAIDYLDLSATSTDKLEVTVSDDVSGELERAAMRLDDPILIDASEFAEQIFRRGDEAFRACRDLGFECVWLASTRGALPSIDVPDATVVIAAWPVELARLEALCAEANRRGLRWGLAIPVVFPVTTNLEVLDRLALMAAANRASFFAALPVDLDATAKRGVAESLALDGDDETYTMLFHADLEPIQTATERHIAALATAIAVEDFVVPPRWSHKSNWNAGVLLTLTAGRMIAMTRDVELAGTLARSARAVAALDKPIELIASAANLGIIETLDIASVDILTEWIEAGRSSFVEGINEEWRLRRDYRG